jgi:hypothetical protein
MYCIKTQEVGFMAICTMFGMHPIVLSALAITYSKRSFSVYSVLLLAQDAHGLAQKSEDRTGKLLDRRVYRTVHAATVVTDATQIHSGPSLRLALLVSLVHIS